MADSKKDRKDKLPENDQRPAPPKKEEEVVVDNTEEKKKGKGKQEQPKENKKSGTPAAGSIVEGLQNLMNLIPKFKNPLEMRYDACCKIRDTAKQVKDFVVNTPGAIYRAGKAVHDAPGNLITAITNVGKKIGSAVLNTFSPTPVPPKQKTDEAIKREQAPKPKQDQEANLGNDNKRPKI